MTRAKTCARDAASSAEGSQTSIRRNSYNDRAAKIAAIVPKPAEFTVKLDLYLIIANRLARLYLTKHI